LSLGGKLYPGVGVEQGGEDREYKSYYQAEHSSTKISILKTKF